MTDWLGQFMAEEQLPPAFRRTFDDVCGPLADRAQDWRKDFGRTAVVGLCGSQGSGKTTIAAAAVRLLKDRGLNAVAISLDDFYLPRDARARLAAQVHRLLQVRGPPGTHEVALASGVLDQLAREGVVALPAFDKATDERKPRWTWREVESPPDVIIFEGWCVGARPEPAQRLRDPVNLLEKQGDPTGAWRGYVNRQLSETYQALFRRLDRLVLLAAPNFDAVRKWRMEQEAKLRARTGQGMTDVEVSRFMLHYERLTRWILTEMPERADWLVPLEADRTPILP